MSSGALKQLMRHTQSTSNGIIYVAVENDKGQHLLQRGRIRGFSMDIMI